MPLPLILGIAAGIAGVAGIGSGIHGGVKMKEANDTMKSAQNKHEAAQKKFTETNDRATKAMDRLGTTELETLKSFETFSDIIERIQNRPEFAEIHKGDVKLPEFTAEELKQVYVGAGVVLGGLGGAAAGTAGGIAAAGATTTAVMALGTASTGTAIASLSGAAATNATLAALGGGALAAHGGGIALGTAVLGGATLGVGLLVGGIIFNFTGSKLSDKADEAWSQARKEEEQVNKICKYFNRLTDSASNFNKAISKVRTVYQNHISQMKSIVLTNGKTNWYDFTEQEKMVVENAYKCVAMLYRMCKVQLVLKSDDENEMNTVNNTQIYSAISDSERLLENIA